MRRWNKKFVQKRTFAPVAIGLLSLFAAQTASAAVVAELDFTSTSGALDVTADGNISGATAGLAGITGIDGVTGVLSAVDAGGVTGNDPKLLFSGTTIYQAALPSGFTSWDSMEVRFRQLDGDPGAPGVASQPYDLSGTILIYRVNGVQTNTAGLAVGSTSGLVSLANDPAGDNWLVYTVDFSGFGPTDLVGIQRLDPIGNDLNGNFEVDYVRLNGVSAVPEPTSLAMLSVAGLGFVVRRRRR